MNSLRRGLTLGSRPLPPTPNSPSSGIPSYPSKYSFLVLRNILVWSCIFYTASRSNSQISQEDFRQFQAPSPSPSLQERYRKHQLAMRGTTPNLPSTVAEYDQPSSRDSGYPDWDQDQRGFRNRTGSVSGSDVGSRVSRKLSNTSCPPSARGLPHTTSVFDLNNPMQYHNQGAFVPMQQVRFCCYAKCLCNGGFPGTFNGSTKLSDAGLPERLDGTAPVLLESFAR